MLRSFHSLQCYKKIVKKFQYLLHFRNQNPLIQNCFKRLETSQPADGRSPNLNIILPPNQPEIEDQPVGKLIVEKCAEEKFFYGVELITRKRSSTPGVLDFRIFGDYLPLFFSIVWIATRSWNVVPIECTETISLALRLRTHFICVPHFTSFRVSEERLEEFVALNWCNILALLGNEAPHPEQPYKNASDMAIALRCMKGDNISIGVAGYPCKHHAVKTTEEDMRILLEKVESGAEYIITEICFDTPTTIKFVKRCRDAGITIPIMVGLVMPKSMRALNKINELAHVRPSPEEMNYIKTLEPKEFQEHFKKRTECTIIELLSANIGIYGFHFYSFNHFDDVRTVLDRLREKGIC